MYLCISVFVYFCVFVFQGLAGCTCAPHTKDIWRPPALHILSFSYVATYTVSSEGLHIYCHSPPFTVSTEGLPVHLLQPPG